MPCLSFGVGGERKSGVKTLMMERTRTGVLVLAGGNEEVTEVRL